MLGQAAAPRSADARTLRPSPLHPPYRTCRMSVLLTGRNGKIMLAAPHRPMLLRPLPVGQGEIELPAATSLSGTAGLAGWWDAAAPSGLLSQGGAALGGNGAAVGAVADRSGAAQGL